MNNDSIIDARDASNVLSLYAKASTNVFIADDVIRKGDVNKDGILDGRDASIILAYYAKTSSGKNLSFIDYLDSLKDEQ